MRRIHSWFLTSLVVGLGCTAPDGGSVTCGLAALSGPLVAMESFARGSGLAEPPTALPANLPARFVAGPAGLATIAVTDSGQLAARFETAIPDRASPGYGVLVIDERGTAMGILVFDGVPIPGAVPLGDIALVDSNRTLFGVRVPRQTVETDACPLFPIPPDGTT